MCCITMSPGHKILLRCFITTASGPIAQVPKGTTYPPYPHFWCTPTKQRTSCTGLFWDMDNSSWLGVKKNSSVDSEIFFFTYFNMLICFLSPPCNFWLTSNIFPLRFLHFLQPVIPKTKRIGNFKGQFLKIKLPQKPLTVLSQK